MDLGSIFCIRPRVLANLRDLRADLHGTIFVACDNGSRQAHDMIYDCCVRQKNVVAF